MLEDDFLTNSVAFHAQQVVEKCFKAILEEYEQKVPSIHSLLRLFDAIFEVIDFGIDENMLERTDAIYIESRYPCDFGMLPDGKPTLEEAKSLYEFAAYIYQNTIDFLAKTA